MKETWRNLWRRKLRTFLTILGIVVGTMALTTMGAMSEKINLLVSGALRYYGTRIVVEPLSSGLPGPNITSIIPSSLAEDIKKVSGVDEAFPIVYSIYEEREGVSSLALGALPLAIGVDPLRFSYTKDTFPIVVSKGRVMAPEERKVAVVGVDLANFKHLHIGDTMTLKGTDFQVIGIIERTLTPRDNFVFIPLADAQYMMAASLPPPLNSDPSSLASQIEVYPTDLKQADMVAKTINEQMTMVKAFSPGEMKRQFQQSLLIFNVIIVGSAVIAVVVGGLSILNTMVTAVTERTREIGIKKAIGATDGDILRELLREAAVIGLIGGILGLAGGAALVSVVNNFTASMGVEVFAITPRLSIGVVLFSTALGAGAGLFPALMAARRSPVDALRAE